MEKTKKVRKPKEPHIEIARSFSYKYNVGNYESRDFFCSAKKEVKESEAENTSEALYAFCKKEVLKGVNELKKQIDEEINGVAVQLEKEQNAMSSAQHDSGN